jgi:membrane-associated phospholipid phosphatase
LVSSFGVQLFVPGALLLVGYWLSGFFFRDPQPWLERFLLQSDRTVFQAAQIDRLLRRAPRWVLELLEASYAADYVVVGGGAIIAALISRDAVTAYWSLVLAAELACYAALPWLRSRPPRVIEGPAVIESRAPVLRRLNTAILDGASVQANTLPSGHVAGALAASLALTAFLPVAALVFGVLTVLIALSAALCRYHYVVDCVSGAAVAILAWVIVA